MNLGVLEKYREHLPITDNTPLITLGEGATPLVRSRRLAYELGCPGLYFKLEGCNPTGSFKDRGMVLAVAKAMEQGSRRIVCASTGNTSASAAAYGASVGIPVSVLVPQGDVALGKLAQARAHKANIVAVDGNFDEALTLVRSLAETHEVTLVNSVNPNRIEGQKTAAFEIIDDLGVSPDLLCLPVGNAGNITAYWKGFVEYHKGGKSEKLPRMMGFQAEGAAPIVNGHPVTSPKTIASAIRIGLPASWDGAIRARDESGGMVEAVSDQEIVEAYGLMASVEGIFCEPASAASVAGLMKLQRRGMDLSSYVVVCVITGTGLKDPDMAVSAIETNIKEVSSNPVDVSSALLMLDAL